MIIKVAWALIGWFMILLAVSIVLTIIQGVLGIG